MSESTLNNKRIAKNTIMLYIRMLLSVVVSLYTSRIVLEVLGVEDYGIYGLVGGIVSMVPYVKFNMFHKEQTRKYKNNPFLPANMYYNKDEDYYVCPMGHHLEHVRDRTINLYQRWDMNLWYLYIVPLTARAAGSEVCATKEKVTGE